MAWLQTQVCHTLLCPEAFLHYQSSIIMIMTSIHILIANHQSSLVNNQSSSINPHSSISNRQASIIRNPSSIINQHQSSWIIVNHHQFMINGQSSMTYLIILYHQSSIIAINTMVVFRPQKNSVYCKPDSHLIVGVLGSLQP